MKKTLMVVGIILCAAAAWAQSPNVPAAGGVVEHGRYLVSVTGCNDCHTPRLKNGMLDQTHKLCGTTLDFGPLHPMPHWAKKSPEIAGLKHWTDEQALKFLTTGLDKHGEHADPPMPRFHFNQNDARDIIAYLRTLK
ncbi:MAG TPA: c-type cytochrome [Candidatus Xenobia bacterium]|jgi:mono/diheme cytochrome c family protein